MQLYDRMEHLRHCLAETLQQIARNDDNYGVRYGLVYGALSMAVELGYRAGVSIDPADPEWPIVYIDLPEVGQCSWHMPAYEAPWDHHTTQEKYERVRQWVDSVLDASEPVPAPQATHTED